MSKLLYDYTDNTIPQFFKNKEVRRELCKAIAFCGVTEGGTALTSVATQDSATVTWSGNGTASSPLVATVIGDAANPPNLLIVATDANGDLVDGSGNVITRTLVGFATGANTSIAASDTILTAFGKTQGQINAKASLASPVFTGTPSAPTAAPGTNTTQIATTQFVTGAISAIIPINLYNTNGTLTSARVVAGNGNTLSFNTTRILVNGAPDDAVSALKVAGDIVAHGSKFMCTDNTVQMSMLTPGTNDGVIGTQSNHSVVFITNNSEKARILPTGRFLISTTTDDGSTTLQVNGTIKGAIQNGVSDNRPSSPLIGQQYFDTEISPARPIWYNGTAWVDATGTNV